MNKEELRSIALRQKAINVKIGAYSIYQYHLSTVRIKNERVLPA
jgi:hypothetical protein